MNEPLRMPAIALLQAMVVLIILGVVAHSTHADDDAAQVSVMHYTEQELTFMVSDVAHKALVRTPTRLAPRPALLINLAMDRRFALEQAHFRIVPDIFLAAGHRVVSIDLPNHGELCDEFGCGIGAWAKAAKADVDIFQSVAAVGKSLIDLLIKENLASPRAIVLNGTSRGGSIAMHIMAADDRVLAAAIHSPVTHLPALAEFAGMEENPIVMRSNAEMLIPKLKDRPIFIAIGERDERISAESAFHFHARLRAASQSIFPELYTAPGYSHRLGEGSYPAETGYQAAAGYLLIQCAQQLKR